MMDERDRTRDASASGQQGVPSFYREQESASSLKSRLRKEARLRLLGSLVSATCQVKNDLILDNTKLEQIWYILRQYTGVSSDLVDGDRLNYDEFCQASTACQDVFGSALETFFRPSVFLRLERDSHGTIALLSLFNYIMRRNAMLQTRVHLSCFDEDGTGHLSEEQLQSYIGQLVPELPGLRDLERHMDLQTYSRIAIRKFLLLHGRGGRMKIRELLPSATLAELLEMRLPAAGDGGANPPPEPSSNFFSLGAILRLVHQFQALDVDCNGHLSQSEFAGLSSGTMTPLFISRVFEEHAAAKQKEAAEEGEPHDTVAGEMDFVAYVDFVLAWDHRSTPQGLRYFFPVLDLHGRGAMTQVDVYAFLRDIYAMWLACGQYKELSIEDVKDEIFDIVKPVDALRITARDFMKCGMAGTIISMLADVNLFWEYDMRETLLQPEEPDEALLVESLKQ